MTARVTVLVLTVLACALHGVARAQVPPGATATPPGAAADEGKRLAQIVVVGAGSPAEAAPVFAASSGTITAEQLADRPHDTMREVLSNVPSLVVSQHQGGGKAPQYLIRGFDADHGSDFAVFVDDLPVNLVSHAHGQGYADVNFVIPETIQRMDLRLGPYYADVGDFANAGALNVVTLDEVPQNFALAEGGSFSTMRYVALASPRVGGAKALLAAQAYFSDGPFINPQNYARYNGFAKVTLEPTADSRLSIWTSVYQGDWDASGQIPEREVAAGRLPRFGAIDPTEGGTTDREDLNLHYTFSPAPEHVWTFQAYVSRYKLALYSNFTFYKDTGLRFADAAGNYLPGDGIEQNDQRVLYGGRLRYTRFWEIVGRPVESQAGVELRADDIDLALYRQLRRQRFYAVNKLQVFEQSMSGFMQHEVFLTDWIRLQVGLRGDVYLFNAQNRLPQQAEDPNFTAVLIQGNTSDSIVSPKATVIATVLPRTDLFLNFGSGFHSNDARNAILAATSGSSFNPLTRSLGYEIGVRSEPLDRWQTRAALWLLDLDSELVFSGDAGNQEIGAGGSFQPSPATRRWGIDAGTEYAPVDWLLADYSLAYVDPQYRASGEAIPLAPTLYMQGGLTTRFRNGFSAGLRVRFLDNRPATEDRSLTAQGYTLLDLLARYRWRNVEASLALLNLTNTNWREAQFSDTTCVRREVGSGNCLVSPGQQGTHADPPPDIHHTPGNPLAVRGGLTVFF